MSTLMFLHGQGFQTAEEVDTYLKDLRQVTPTDICTALSYGSVIEGLGFRFMDIEASQMLEADMGEEKTLSYLEGYWDAQFGIDDEPVFGMSGELRDHPVRTIRDTWLYSVRYLLRRTVHDAVLTHVLNQLRREIRERSLGSRSIVLIAHSLGSVVALDVLQNTELSSFFARFVSIGSPLSAITAAPRNRMLVPLSVRACPVPWIDIAAENDWIVYPRFLVGSPPRLSERKDFSGDGRPVNGITLPPIQGNPHSDYFSVHSVLEKWIEYLM